MPHIDNRSTPIDYINSFTIFSEGHARKHERVYLIKVFVPSSFFWGMYQVVYDSPLPKEVNMSIFNLSFCYFDDFCKSSGKQKRLIK